MQKSTTAVAGGGTGVIYTPGTKQVANPLKFNAEVGLAFSSANSVNSRVYFEHAFEAPSAQVALVGSNQTDELPTGYSGDVPAGMTFSNNQDQGNGNYGYVQITTNTLSSGGTPGTYKFRHSIDQGGWSRSYIDYEIEVFPSGTTPTQANSSILLTMVIRNTSAQQQLTDTITGSQIVGMKLKDITGVPTGYELKLNTANGVVYYENTPNTTHASTAHSFTVEVDLGQYGTVDYVYSGSITYGDPYGSRYFGPNNASTNFTSSQNYADTQSASDTGFNPAKSSGALRRVYNVNEDTSPYLHNDGYGCAHTGNRSDQYTNSTYYNDVSGYGAFGYMGYNADNSNWFCSSSNYQVIKVRWTVPNGVTSFCAVAVGGGGPGAYSWASDAGGAGGLAWMNGISCSSGQVYYIYVGLGRECESSNSSYGAGSSFIVHPNGQTILYAQGGGYSGHQQSNPNGQLNLYDHTPNNLNYWEHGSAYGANDSRDAGGYGFNTAYGTTVNGFHYGGGAATYAGGSRVGMGAAGYRGNQPGNNGNSDRGYKGGGGNGYDYSSTYGYGGGGGVGLDGQGWRGVDGGSSRPRNDSNAGSGYGGSAGSWTSYNNSSANFYGGGGGGSGGTRGAWGENQFTGREENNGGHRVRVGGTHGGGGGGSGTSYGGGNGAPGGVRIIWGAGADGTPRSFPYTYCSEKPSMKYNGEA
jgi:hypothetical protein